MLERSLEIAEVLRGGGRRSWRQESGLHIFWKYVRETLSRPSINEFKLANCDVDWPTCRLPTIACSPAACHYPVQPLAGKRTN